MFIHPVSYEELNRLITCLNTSKSAGPDNIGPTLVKSAYICEPLLHIFNLSISNGIVPDQLKEQTRVVKIKSSNFTLYINMYVQVIIIM